MFVFQELDEMIFTDENNELYTVEPNVEFEFGVIGDGLYNIDNIDEVCCLAFEIMVCNNSLSIV